MSGKTQDDTGVAPENVSATPDGSTTGNIDAKTVSLSSAIDSHTSGYEGFDPTIHAVGDDGQPKRTKGGDFAKKRGRKSGGAPGVTLPPPGTPQATEPQKSAEAVTKAAAEYAARNTLNILFNVAVIGISDEWKPKPDEADGLKSAFTDYYMVRGIPNIPPELALIGALVAYAVPRIALPKTQAKIKRLKNVLSGRADQPVESPAIES